MIDLGIVRPGSTIRIPFSTFDKDDGSSITMTNFAAADILVYKDGNTTARASTSGFTATTDFNSKTGKQLIVIDLSDNTTADFWASGSEYLVAVDAVTVDTITVGSWVARFRIGYHGSWFDTTIATLASQTSFTLTTGPAEDDALNGHRVLIHDAASAVQCSSAIVLDYTGSTKTVTLAAAPTFTIAAKDNISLMEAMPLQPATIGRTALVASDGSVSPNWADVKSPTTTLNLSGTTVKTATDVETDTQDIQGRLPAALTGAGNIKADALALSGDATAADNAEAFFDGTGYAGTNNVIPTVTSVTNRVTANTDQLAGQTVTAAAGVTFPTSVASPTNITAGTITTVTNLTNAPTNGDLTAAMKASVNAEVDSALDTAIPGSPTANSVNERVKAIDDKLPSGTISDLTAAQVNTEADQALADVGVTTTVTGRIDAAITTRAAAALFTGITSVAQWLGLLAGKQAGNSTARTELRATGAGSGTFDETTDSLEAQRDNYTTPPTAGAIADQVWEEAVADHSGTSGSTAEALSAAGSAGDPWATAIPGAYGAGTAGKIVGDNLNATVGSRATQTSVDDLPTNAELATALAGADDAVLAAIAALNNLSQANIRTAIGLASANLDTQLDALPTNAELATALAAADDAVLAAIAALNNLSQANIRTAVGLASANLDTQLDALPTNAELATALAAADDAVLAAIAALNNLSAAQVKTQVVAALNTDTYAEPAAVPAATATLVAKINWLAALARNKVMQTSSTQTLRNDGDSADIATAAVSDDLTTFTRGEWA